MTKKLITDTAYIEDLMDVDSLESAMTNLNDFIGTLRNHNVNPKEVSVNFPYQEKPYLEYKRLENEDEYQRRLKKEAETIANEMALLKKLKAKYES